MSKKYIKPSPIQRFVQRHKRKTPAIFVDAFDCTHRLLHGFKIRYPYNTNREGYHPFFIIGSGRSGNTLLRKLLMERSVVAIPPEIPGLGSTIRTYTQCGALPWDETVKNILLTFRNLADVDVKTKDALGNELIYNLLHALALDFNVIEKSLINIKEQERALSTIISTIFEAYSIKEYGTVRCWGDKTPWNIFHYARIRKVYPHARYVHMLRDGRDCVASYVESLGELLNMDSVNAAYRWRDSVRCAENIRRENPSRFIEVRYEELVSKPYEVVSNLIGFLGLKPVSTAEVHIDTIGDGKAIHHRNLFLPVSERSVGRWREFLCGRELKAVLQIFHRDLEYYGYKV